MKITTPKRFSNEMQVRSQLINELIKFFKLEPEFGYDGTARLYNRSTLESLLEHIKKYSPESNDSTGKNN